MKFQRFTLLTLFKGNPETAIHSNHRANRVRLELSLTLAFLILAGWLAMPEHFMKRKVWAHFTAGASQTTSIACGQTIPSSISEAGEQDTYIFNADAGEAVSISAVATSGDLCARIELYNPSGALIAATSQFVCNTNLGSVLPATGTYTILVRDLTLNRTGAYNVNLQLITGRCAGPIACGQKITIGTDILIGQQDAYKFNGSANEVVSISAIATSGLLCSRIELYSPSGALISATSQFVCNTDIRSALPVTGIYTILVRDLTLNRTGAYNLNLQFTTGRCAATVICGEKFAADTPISIGQQDGYKFGGIANEAVSISAVATSGNLCARIELYNPSGALIAATSQFVCNTNLVSVLPVTGTYTILVRDLTLNRTGAYNLNLQFTTGRCAMPITCGQTRGENITCAGQQDVFTFCGIQGSSVTISAVATSGDLCSRIELYNPSGGLVGATSQFDCNTNLVSVLPVTGTYAILVRDLTLNRTGAYNINLTCIGPVCQPLSITLTPNPLTITAGASGDMTVTINPARTTAATVMLSSSDTTVATVPASVTISANAPSTTFQVMGKKGGMATITATLDNVSAPAKVNVNNPAPALSSLAPFSATAGAPSFTLTVNGANFVDDSKVRWNGSERTTSFVSPTQLTAMITAADIAMQGTALVTVFNPPPGGGVSPPLSFTITPARIVKVMDASGNAGATVTVPIKLISLGDENALGFSLTFDTAVLSNPQATLCGDAAGAMLTPNPSQIGQGRLGIAIALPPGQVFPTGERCIVNVTFTIAANAQAGMTEIGFGDQPIARQVVGVTANPLSGTDYVPGKVTIVTGYECDVAPRPNGDGRCTIADWVQCGRFAAGLDTPANGSEFQRADCAPKETRGDGRLSIADWVQCGRCAAGLDPLVPAGGPTSPASALVLAARIGLPAADARDEIASARLLYLAETAIEYGASKSIAVTLDTRGDENAAGFSLSFDPRQWRFVSAVVGRDAPNAALQVNDSQVKSGRIGFALALPAGETLAMGTRLLVVVTFAAVAEGQFDTSIIRLADLPIAPEVVDANAKPLPVHYRDETDAPVKTVRDNLK